MHRMTETVERMLADIEKLAPEIRAHATKMEEARRLSDDLVATLKSIGVFRMLVPRISAIDDGGLETRQHFARESAKAVLTRASGQGMPRLQDGIP